MTIHPPRSRRLTQALVAGPMAIAVTLLAAYALIWTHTWTAVVALPVAAFLGWGALTFGRDAPLTVDDREVIYAKPLAAPRQCAKADIARTDHVLGSRGTSELRFIGRDGSRLMKVDHTYEKADLEALAKYIGVPLNLDMPWSWAYPSRRGRSSR